MLTISSHSQHDNQNDEIVLHHHHQAGGERLDRLWLGCQTGSVGDLNSFQSEIQYNKLGMPVWVP